MVIKMPSKEVEAWLLKVLANLKKDLGLSNIAVTGGGYRGSNVNVEYLKDRDIYHVDFYSPIRFDDRFNEAYKYVINWIKNKEESKKNK